MDSFAFFFVISSFVWIPTVLATVDPRFSITSKFTCIRHTDCPPSFFCDGSESVPLCRLRYPTGAFCNGGVHECQDGSQCEQSREGRPRCRLTRKIGQSCVNFLSCAKGLYCSSKNKCVSLEPLGAACSSTFSCRYPLNCFNGHCRAPLPNGQPCRREDDFSDCSGFCLGSFGLSLGSVRPTCASARSINSTCSMSQQCDGWGEQRAHGPRFDSVICNRPTFETGVCTRISALHTKLGAACDPTVDLCDMDRNLRCRFSLHLGRHVCQHKIQFLGNGRSNKCEPRSRLSRCRRSISPLECRRERSTVTDKIDGVYRCNRRLEFLPQGSMCNRAEHARCKGGLQCSPVPGIPPLPGFRGPPSPPIRFCVRMVGEGADCRNKFRKQCRSGLVCKAGKCRWGKSKISESQTHADLSSSCARFPCVPGAICSKDKICVLPIKIVGKGTPCFDKALFQRRCSHGLFCGPGPKGYGINRCRRSARLGQTCFKDKNCMGWLKCSPFIFRTNGDRQARCYNPALSLPIGAPCKIHAGENGKRCFIGSRSFIDKPAKCLPAGHGFKCQTANGLFEPCSGNDGIACDYGLVCRRGFCFPKL